MVFDSKLSIYCVLRGIIWHVHICCLQLRRPAAPLAQYWHSTQADREEIVPLPRSGCETVRIRCHQKGTRDHSPILLSAETRKQLRATRRTTSGSWKGEQASISLQWLSSNVKRPFLIFFLLGRGVLRSPTRYWRGRSRCWTDVGGEDAGRFCCRITPQATIATSGLWFQSKSLFKTKFSVKEFCTMSR